MAELIKKTKARYRIVIHDLIEKESRTISLTDGINIDEIKKRVEEIFT